MNYFAQEESKGLNEDIYLFLSKLAHSKNFYNKIKSIVFPVFSEDDKFELNFNLGTIIAFNTVKNTNTHESINTLYNKYQDILDEYFMKSAIRNTIMTAYIPVEQISPFTKLAIMLEIIQDNEKIIPDRCLFQTTKSYYCTHLTYGLYKSVESSIDEDIVNDIKDSVYKIIKNGSKKLYKPVNRYKSGGNIVEDVFKEAIYNSKTELNLFTLGGVIATVYYFVYNSNISDDEMNDVKNFMFQPQVADTFLLYACEFTAESTTHKKWWNLDAKKQLQYYFSSADVTPYSMLFYKYDMHEYKYCNEEFTKDELDLIESSYDYIHSAYDDYDLSFTQYVDGAARILSLLKAIKKYEQINNQLQIEKIELASKSRKLDQKDNEIRSELARLEQSLKTTTDLLNETMKSLANVKSENEKLKKKEITDRLQDDNDRNELIALRKFAYLSSKEFQDDNEDMININSIITELAPLKVAIVGGHSTWQKRLKEHFPDWRFIDVNTTNDNVLDGIDIVFIFTGLCSHSMYYKIKKLIGNRKMYYLSNTNIKKTIMECYSMISN